MANPLLARRALLLSALAAWRAASAGPGDDDAAEYQVKAAFVCKFGNYVEWPAQSFGAAGDPLRIGVYASGPVLEAFRSTAAAAGSVSGHPLEVKRLARGEPAEGVHIVFLPRAMSASAGEVLSYVQGRPVLTVTELDPGGPAGMINFVVVDDKVRFDIVLPPATQSGLKISVRLLGVARRVEGRS